MPITKRPRTRVAIAATVVLVCAVGAVLWYLYATEDAASPMQDYTAERQQTAARAIVDGLNSRNPDNVDLLRNQGPDRDADNAQIVANITAVMPPAGCRYFLDSVHDRGEQDPADVPWFTAANRARGFDMDVRVQCPGQSPTPRTIRVIAIPSGMGGYWAEAALFAQP